MKTNMKKGRTMWQCWILMLWATGKMEFRLYCQGITNPLRLVNHSSHRIDKTLQDHPT